MTRRLLEQMLVSSEEDRLEMAALVPACNEPELHRLAHRIKGAARIIRATRVIETCEALEGVSLANTTQDVMKDRQHAIVDAMLDLEQALREALSRAA